MDVARLCSDLIQIESENPPGRTAEVIEYICGYLDALGIQSTVIRNSGGRDNLIAVSPQNRLLLCGHVDVVPALRDGWKFDPYAGCLHEGFVWGRGASDMKGGCAALLHALKTVLDAGREPKANVAFVCDEESGGKYGIRQLLRKNLLPPADCLIAEPTPPLSPVIGQKGLCRLNLEFAGEPGHGSLYPRVGISAVMEAFALLERVKVIHAKEFEGPPQLAGIVDQSSRVLEGIFGVKDVMRRVTFNPGRIEGGEKANVVAQHCSLELDMRVPFGCSVRDLMEYVARHAPRATVTVMDCAEPGFTAPDAPIVAVLSAEIERVYAERAVPIVQWAASDAKFLREAGFSVVEYGPGELATLHAVDERVAVHQLEKAVEIYRGFILKYS